MFSALDLVKWAAMKMMFFAAIAVSCSGETPVGTPNAQEQNRGFDYAVRMHSEHWFYSDTELAKALDMARLAGANTIDTPIVWTALDRGDQGGQRHTYSWDGLDRLMRAASVRGMKVNFQIQTTPDWVHPYLKDEVRSKEVRKWYAPRGETELQHFSTFVGDVAERYKGRVNNYEVWNEPNHTPFWRSGPDPAEYAALLRTAYVGLKREDPNAKVVFGGLALNNLGYLREYYRVVEERYPDAASNDYFFDVLGVHPYVHPYGQSPDRYARDVVGELDDDRYDFIGEVDGNFLGFRRMKRLMDEEEDRSTKMLYFGEFGYPTTPEGVPDFRRALFLKRAYELARNEPYVQGMDWFTYYANDVADPPEWALLDEDLNPSLTYQAYAEVTGAKASSVEVSISVSRSISGIYSLQPRLSNLSFSEVRFWELYVDGELIKKQTTVPLKWSAADTGAEAQQVLVAAYTAGGSVWYSDAVAFDSCGSCGVVLLTASNASHHNYGLVEREQAIKPTYETPQDYTASNYATSEPPEELHISKESSE
jgi:YD repeat-containing protein